MGQGTTTYSYSYNEIMEIANVKLPAVVLNVSVGNLTYFESSDFS